MDKSYTLLTDQLQALVITYNPSSNFEQHLKGLLEIFNHIIIVDNGSLLDFQIMLKAQAQNHEKAITVLINQRNLGIATALNQGLEFAIHQGYKHIITLDQDSVPTPDMAKALLNGFQSHPNRKNLAILAPLVMEEIVNVSPRFFRSKKYSSSQKKSLKKNPLIDWAVCEETFLRNVTSVITSGSFYNLEIYQKIGPFRDNFFIDYVDTEYCLRAVQHGYEISVLCNAKLIHNLGQRQKKKLMWRTFYPTFHTPHRLYYISRNRIAMLHLYAWRFPHWFYYEMYITLTGMILIFLLEDRRFEKLKAIFIGTIDGILGRMGEISLLARKILKLA